MWQKLLLLAAAGAVGTLARYGLLGVVQRVTGAGFPWGTLAVNAVGCFAAAFLWTLAEDRLALGGEARAVVFIGFMGAFTTFSAVMLETGALVRDAEWIMAAGNVTLQNVVGFAALVGGHALARLL